MSRDVDLEARPTVVIDGGLATELERRGCDLSGPLWSAHVLLNRPDLVEAVHTDYLEAGADCIITSSYQVSFEGFARAGLSPEQTVEALRRSTAMAGAARARLLRASGRRAWVAASLGPYGAMLHNGAEYHGRYDVAFDTLVAFHRSRLEHLQHGVDLIACETVPSVEEAEAMLRALAGFPHLRAWVSFTCADQRVTGRGDLIADAARLVSSSSQVVAVGVNCTPPGYVPALVDAIRHEIAKPIVVYPNSGEAWDAAGRCWVGEPTTTDYGRQARDWYARGARWIGGCCRTTPGHVAALRRVLDECARGDGS